MKPQANIVRVVRCIHPHWTGYIQLFEDGTCEHVGVHTRGRWRLNAGLLSVAWDRYGQEYFREVRGEFIFSSIKLPKLESVGTTFGSPYGVVAQKIADHPDAVAWVRNEFDNPTVGIVVPYRDREEHLKKFLPHLISFFNRDLNNCHIKPLVVISEQADEKKFNRGLCCNAGFLAVEKYCGHVCFHDVDYLPMWADYSYSSFPGRIIWSGLNYRPIRVSPENKKWVTTNKSSFGAVIAIDKEQFKSVNGFSNNYQGWGLEDADLRDRLQSYGIPLRHRDGTFIPLDHDHQGYTDSGEKSPDWIDNEAVFRRMRPQYWESRSYPEGLSTIPIDNVEITFESWMGLEAAESMLICRLRIRQA